MAAVIARTYVGAAGPHHPHEEGVSVVPVRSWTHYDPSSDTTCVVTLSTRRSLRVRLCNAKSASSSSGDRNRRRHADPLSSMDAESCGVEWRFALLQGRGRVAINACDGSDATSQHRRLAIFRFTDVEVETWVAAGYGGVVFASSGAVLVHTHRHHTGHMSMNLFRYNATGSWEHFPAALTLPVGGLGPRPTLTGADAPGGSAELLHVSGVLIGGTQLRLRYLGARATVTATSDHQNSSARSGTNDSNFDFVVGELGIDVVDAQAGERVASVPFSVRHIFTDLSVPFSTLGTDSSGGSSGSSTSPLSCTWVMLSGTGSSACLVGLLSPPPVPHARGISVHCGAITPAEPCGIVGLSRPPPRDAVPLALSDAMAMMDDLTEVHFLDVGTPLARVTSGAVPAGTVVNTTAKGSGQDHWPVCVRFVLDFLGDHTVAADTRGGAPLPQGLYRCRALHPRDSPPKRWVGASTWWAGLEPAIVASPNCAHSHRAAGGEQLALPEALALFTKLPAPPFPQRDSRWLCFVAEGATTVRELRVFYVEDGGGSTSSAVPDAAVTSMRVTAGRGLEVFAERLAQDLSSVPLAVGRGEGGIREAHAWRRAGKGVRSLLLSLMSVDRQVATSWMSSFMRVIRQNSLITQPSDHTRSMCGYAHGVLALYLAECQQSTSSTAVGAGDGGVVVLQGARAFFKAYCHLLAQMDWLWAPESFVADSGSGYDAAPAAFTVLQCVTLHFLGAGTPDCIHAATGTTTPLDAYLSPDEQLCVQVLLELGHSDQETAETRAAYAWLRKLLLLYTCRRKDVPLELLLGDMLSACLASASVAADDRDESALTEMEGALLQIVDVQALYSALGHLHVPLSVPSLPSVMPRGGVLSLAGLWELCCQWDPRNLSAAATEAPALLLIPCSVDVARRLVADRHGNSTAGVEATVRSGLRQWEEKGRGEAVEAQPLCVPSSMLAGGLCVNQLWHFPWSTLSPLASLCMLDLMMCRWLQWCDDVRENGTGKVVDSVISDNGTTKAEKGEEDVLVAVEDGATAVSLRLRQESREWGAAIRDVADGAHLLYWLAGGVEKCADDIVHALMAVVSSGSIAVGDHCDAALSVSSFAALSRMGSGRVVGMCRTVDEDAKCHAEGRALHVAFACATSTVLRTMLRGELAYTDVDRPKGRALVVWEYVFATDPTARTNAVLVEKLFESFAHLQRANLCPPSTLEELMFGCCRPILLSMYPTLLKRANREQTAVDAAYADSDVLPQLDNFQLGAHVRRVCVQEAFVLTRNHLHRLLALADGPQGPDEHLGRLHALKFLVSALAPAESRSTGLWTEQERQRYRYADDDDNDNYRHHHFILSPQAVYFLATEVVSCGPQRAGHFTVVMELLRRDLTPQVLSPMPAGLIASADCEGPARVTVGGELEVRSLLHRLGEEIDACSSALRRCPSGGALVSSGLRLLLLDVVWCQFVDTDPDDASGPAVSDEAAAVAPSQGVRYAASVVEDVVECVLGVARRTCEPLRMDERQLLADTAVSSATLQEALHSQWGLAPRDEAPREFTTVNCHSEGSYSHSATHTHILRQLGELAEAQQRAREDGHRVALHQGPTGTCAMLKAILGVPVRAPLHIPAARTTSSSSTPPMGPQRRRSEEDEDGVRLGGFTRALFGVLAAPAPAPSAALGSPSPVLRWLVTEEAHRRQQLCVEWGTAFHCQPIQSALGRLYVALRLEKHRREMARVVAEQKDIAFTFVSVHLAGLQRQCDAEGHQLVMQVAERRRRAVEHLTEEEWLARRRVMEGCDRRLQYIHLASTAQETIMLAEEAVRTRTVHAEENARDSVCECFAREELLLLPSAGSESAGEKSDAISRGDDDEGRGWWGSEGAPDMSADVSQHSTFTTTLPEPRGAGSAAVAVHSLEPVGAREMEGPPVSLVFGTFSRLHAKLRETVAPAPISAPRTGSGNAAGGTEWTGEGAMVGQSSAPKPVAPHKCSLTTAQHPASTPASDGWEDWSLEEDAVTAGRTAIAIPGAQDTSVEPERMQRHTAPESPITEAECFSTKKHKRKRSFAVAVPLTYDEDGGIPNLHNTIVNEIKRNSDERVALAIEHTSAHSVGTILPFVHLMGIEEAEGSGRLDIHILEARSRSERRRAHLLGGGW